MIITSRMILNPISLDYMEDIFQEFTSDITTYMFPQAPEAISETREFIEKAMKENAQGTNLEIVALDKDTHEFLGCAGLHHLDTHTPELGIWMKKSAQGYGYGKEVIMGLKHWADTHLTYEYLRYPVDTDNIPSKKIPQALGGKLATCYEKVGASGNWLNLEEYHIYR